jgi:CubicO group peptidase (beta-lactamase class C family)
VVIENASGMPYKKYLARSILVPVGMKHTAMERSCLDRWPTDRSEKAMVTAIQISEMSERFSAGGLFSNADDLMTFARGMAAGNILKSSTLTEMWTDRGYGYG